MSSEDLRQYRWEFLRRNERYQKDFKNLEKKLGGAPETFSRQHQRVWLALYSLPRRRVAKDFPGVDLQAVRQGFIALGRFKEKWGVVQIQNPQSPEAPEFFSQSAAKNPMVEVLLPGRKPKSLEEDPSAVLTLRLSLQAPQKEILLQIDELLTLYKKIHAENHFGEMRHPKNAELDDCLRVYDEVVTRKQSLAEAREHLFPLKNSAPQEAQQRLQHLKRLLAAAKRYVEVGLLEDD